MATLISISLVISIGIFVLCLVFGVYGFIVGVKHKSALVIILSLLLVAVVPTTAFTLNHFSNKLGTTTQLSSK